MLHPYLCAALDWVGVVPRSWVAFWREIAGLVKGAQARPNADPGVLEPNACQNHTLGPIAGTASSAQERYLAQLTKQPQLLVGR